MAFDKDERSDMAYLAGVICLAIFLCCIITNGNVDRKHKETMERLDKIDENIDIIFREGNKNFIFLNKGQHEIVKSYQTLGED